MQALGRHPLPHALGPAPSLGKAPTPSTGLAFICSKSEKHRTLAQHKRFFRFKSTARQPAAQPESPRNLRPGLQVLRCFRPCRLSPTAAHQPALGACQVQTQPSASHTRPLSWRLRCARAGEPGCDMRVRVIPTHLGPRLRPQSHPARCWPRSLDRAAACPVPISHRLCEEGSPPAYVPSYLLLAPAGLIIYF